MGAPKRFGMKNGKIVFRSLEFFVIDTCNLRCHQCAASSPYLRSRNQPRLEDFERWLRHLQPVLHTRQLKVLGGEPLLNPELPSFLEIASKSGVFDLIRVTTNGILLDRAPDAFWEHADIVEISWYTKAAKSPTPEKMDSLRALAQSRNVELEVNPVESFTTAISDTALPADQVKGIYEDCGELRWPCFMLHDGRLYRCSRVHTLDRYLDEIGVKHDPFTELDGLLIDDRSTLQQEIQVYLDETQPLKACTYCYGTTGKELEHRQLSVEEIRSRTHR